MFASQGSGSTSYHHAAVSAAHLNASQNSGHPLTSLGLRVSSPLLLFSFTGDGFWLAFSSLLMVAAQGKKKERAVRFLRGALAHTKRMKGSSGCLKETRTHTLAVQHIHITHKHTAHTHLYARTPCRCGTAQAAHSSSARARSCKSIGWWSPPPSWECLACMCLRS